MLVILPCSDDVPEKPALWGEGESEVGGSGSEGEKSEGLGGVEGGESVNGIYYIREE